MGSRLVIIVLMVASVVGCSLFKGGNPVNPTPINELPTVQVILNPLAGSEIEVGQAVYIDFKITTSERIVQYVLTYVRDDGREWQATCKWNDQARESSAGSVGGMLMHVNSKDTFLSGHAANAYVVLQFNVPAEDACKRNLNDTTGFNMFLISRIDARLEIPLNWRFK